MSRKVVVGPSINFRGLVYAPINEQGVVFLFGKIAHDLGMYVELIRPGYPDCIAKRYIGKDRWEEVKIEFEFKSSHFKHDPKEVDMVVCWEHDWPDCPKDIEVIELREVIKTLENYPIEAPDKPSESKFTFDYHYRKGTKETVRLFNELDSKILKFDDKIYRTPHKYSIYYYSPKRVFTTIRIQKKAVRVYLFTDGKRLLGVEPFSGESGGQKWGRIYIKTKRDIGKALNTLKKSHTMINKCIAENRPTGWYAEKD